MTSTAEKVTTIIIFICIGVLLWGAYKFVWTLGSTEDDFEPVCIHGHTYYRANFGVKAMMGIKLDDEGKPVRCE